MMSLAEYRTAQQLVAEQTDPRVLRAYELQNIIEDAQKELEALMADIGTYADKNYVVTDLKPHRVFRPENIAYIRENMPEVWERCKPGQKYVWEQLCATFGEEALLAIVRERNPEEYDNHKNLTLGEFDKITGDSMKKKKHVGKAYTLEHRQSGKSRIEFIGKPLMMTAPSRYAELDDGEEDEE